MRLCRWIKIGMDGFSGNVGVLITSKIKNKHIQTSRRVVYRTRVFNVCSVRHWFYTTNHSVFAFPWKCNFLKKYARTFDWKCKKPQRHSLFSALSVLDNLCSELGQVFVGTVFPSPLPSANMRPNLAIEQGWIPSTLRMKILGQGSFDQPPNNVNCARMDISGEHHICEEVQDELQQRSIIYVKKCKTNYSSVASYMWRSARRITAA